MVAEKPLNDCEVLSRICRVIEITQQTAEAALGLGQLDLSHKTNPQVQHRIGSDDLRVEACVLIVAVVPPHGEQSPQEAFRLGKSSLRESLAGLQP